MQQEELKRTVEEAVRAALEAPFKEIKALLTDLKVRESQPTKRDSRRPFHPPEKSMGFFEACFL